MGVLINASSALLLGSLVLFALINLSSCNAPPRLHTSKGPVDGMITYVKYSPVEVFYGIPYSRPPTGMYRFGHSSLHPGWTDPIDGTVKPPACWQVNDTTYDGLDGAKIWKPDTGMSEDCLFLNVWRPKERYGGALRIMVWIHGGSFWTGSAVLDAYDGAVIASEENVILVTIAYRLGGFGFVHIDQKFQGNYGIYDQMAALHFVKENAQVFGGSRGDITIFGEGAGAVSVGFHLISSISRSRITNAIMQSGSPLADWAIVDKQIVNDNSVKALNSLGCDPTAEPITFFDCLSSLSSEDFTNAFAVLRSQRFQLPVGPIICGFIFQKPIREMFKDIKLTNVIIGVNKNEGVLAGIRGFPENFALEKEGRIRSKSQFRDMFLSLARNDGNFQKKVMKEYHRESVLKNRRLEMADAAIGDLLYKCPALDFATEYTKLGGKVYMYSFEDRLSTNPFPEYMDVPHGSEVEVVFGAPLKEDSANTKEEQDITKQVMGLWSMFAYIGTPTYKDVSWPAFTVENQEYIKIESTGITTATAFRQNTCPLWEEDYTSNISGGSDFNRFGLTSAAGGNSGGP